MKQVRVQKHDAEITIKVSKESVEAYGGMYLAGGVRFSNPDQRDQKFAILLLVDEQTAAGKLEPTEDMASAVHYGMHHLLDMVFVDEKEYNAQQTQRKAKEN